MKSAREISEDDALYEIRRIAYDLYEKSGRKPGSEFESWFEAARIVQGRKQESSRQ